MKQSLTMLFMLAFLLPAFGQEMVIFDFDVEQDSALWEFFTSDAADSNIAKVDYFYETETVAGGAGAFRLEWAAQNIESWGGFSKIEHVADSNIVYDWSPFDSLTFWYNNTVPQSDTGTTHLRVNLYEVSDAPDTTQDATQTEFYYSFHYILDDEPGWNYISIPLIGGDYWAGEGFNRTGWSGITGNDQLDLDKIKGFTFEFSIGGGGEGNVSEGTIIIDQMRLKGLAARSLTFFNGAVAPGNINFGYDTWTSTQSAVYSDEEDVAGDGSGSIKWMTTTDDWGSWSGMTFELKNIINMGYHWQVDTLKFDIMAPADFGDIRLVLLDDADSTITGDLMFEAGYTLEASAVGYDGSWKHVEVPLRDFDRFAGGWNGEMTVAGEMDSTRLKSFRIVITDDPASKAKTVYLDNIWTGSPVFDLVPPALPSNVGAAAGTFLNLVTWSDVEGETNESYNVYYSLDPISETTDLETLEVIGMGIAENIQEANHALIAPASHTATSYYYAVECIDAGGNSSGLSAVGPVNNEARAVTTIHFGAPANFAADGDLSEWAGIEAFRMYVSDNTGTVVNNTDIGDDDDLSAEAFVAMDDNNLYVAFDVNDDVFIHDDDALSYLVDGADLFIGLYDWHGLMHDAYQRGAEPDYHFRFNQNQVIMDNLGAAVVPGTEFAFVEKFPSGYIVEAIVNLDSLATMANPDDARFRPSEGKRIPIDFAINDADVTAGEREGILTYSVNNQDQSYAHVNLWTYTWIGDEVVVGIRDLTNGVPTNYQLFQNYPNPFNPVTSIKYQIAEAGAVSVKIYNVLGEMVVELVNQVQQPGTYEVNFDASSFGSGMYLYQIQAGEFVSTKKMMLLK